MKEFSDAGEADVTPADKAPPSPGELLDRALASRERHEIMRRASAVRRGWTDCTNNCSTLIEHFEKCVPGGAEALAKARRELEEGSVPRRRRRKKEK